MRSMVTRFMVKDCRKKISNCFSMCSPLMSKSSTVGSSFLLLPFDAGWESFAISEDKELYFAEEEIFVLLFWLISNKLGGVQYIHTQPVLYSQFLV